jgi:hypothetical protein
MSFRIITANRLRDGAVIYLGPGYELVERLEAAQRLTTKDEVETALAQGARYVTDRLIVNPYEMEVTETDRGLVPARMREVIRAAGPTVRRDLGKQADKA